MKINLKKLTSLTTMLAAGLLLAANPAKALNFPGNGNGGFGGAVGNGTLSVTDDGTNITFTLLRGGGSLNDVLAIYIDTGATGFADTSGFTDNGGDDRKGVSGYDGGNRSTMIFTNGFRPSYAIAVKSDYMDLFSLVNGSGFTYITGAGQSGSSSSSFSLTITAAQIGLASGVTTNIRIFGTYISTTAYRSTEAIAGNDYSPFGQGSITFTNTAYGTYTFAAPPAPSYPVTFQVDMTAQVASGAFDPNNDYVHASGTFQTDTWNGATFLLTPTVANTNIYTGTYLDYNPSNTVEQFKFNFYHSASSSYIWEDVDNRPFTLQSSGVTNALVYFNDFYPTTNSATTNNLTFSIDMGPQIYLGHFNPGNGDSIQVLGTLESPKWTIGGFVLTNNTALSGNASNIYSGTIPDGNYPGSSENYKFVIHTSGGDTYETFNGGANRTFFTPTGSYAFPLAYFNGITNIYATPVTFQVDMTAPIATGLLNPGNGDTVTTAGTFQNNMTGGSFVLTPSVGNTNLYIGTYTDLNTPGAGEYFKFQIVNSTSTNWESGANHTFVLGSTAMTNPVIYWNGQDPNNVLLVPTWVTFTVDMNGRVDMFGNPFDDANDSAWVDGDFFASQWAMMVYYNDPTLPADFGPHQLFETGLGTLVFTNSYLVPAGNPLQLLYKYGIYHNTAAVNTNIDNEAGFGLNHTRFIRTTGTYALPKDLFGMQLTNVPAATESSFGNLAVGHAAGGHLPITWLGRPGVHLQYRTNLVKGAWVDLIGTDGANTNSWPQTNSSAFFRLINP